MRGHLRQMGGKIQIFTNLFHGDMNNPDKLLNQRRLCKQFTQTSKFNKKEKKNLLYITVSGVPMVCQSPIGIALYGHGAVQTGRIHKSPIIH